MKEIFRIIDENVQKYRNYPVRFQIRVTVIRNIVPLGNRLEGRILKARAFWRGDSR